CIVSAAASDRRRCRIDTANAATDLFTVANQRIPQLFLERSEPWLVVPPLQESSAKNPLSDLLRACGADTTFCLVELDAARLEVKSAEFQNAPHVVLQALDHVLVSNSQDPPG